MKTSLEVVHQRIPCFTVVVSSSVVAILKTNICNSNDTQWAGRKIFENPEIEVYPA